MEHATKKAMASGVLVLAVIAGWTHGAAAHSFNVGLIVATDAPTQAQLREVRDGFLLAAAERDGHPDQESDGHLGGLDVYLFVTDLARAAPHGVRELLGREQIDILAVLGPDRAVAEIRPLLDGARPVLLGPGRLPSTIPSTFRESFESAFGYAPGPHAAAGYNAARRIDAAVRPLDGVDDTAALRQSFAATRDGLSWE
ncbi:MAG: hypothetical protein JSU82_09230 [Rhodospirillales bacterium]|nr:MAG: hypothetical protein JSU82_09230 [Rhodospirillales bacterium]